MRSNQSKALLKKAVLAVTILLLGGGASFAQTVNLTAGPTSITMPDGNMVPMWVYACGGQTGSATCAPSNPNSGGWSPVIITVPPGNLTINLTNALPTPPGASTGIPTSLVIVGQLGGGLGDLTQRTT